LWWFTFDKQQFFKQVFYEKIMTEKKCVVLNCFMLSYLTIFMEISPLPILFIQSNSLLSAMGQANGDKWLNRGIPIKTPPSKTMPIALVGIYLHLFVAMLVFSGIFRGMFKGAARVITAPLKALFKGYTKSVLVWCWDPSGIDTCGDREQRGILYLLLHCCHHNDFVSRPAAIGAILMCIIYEGPSHN